VCSQLLGLDPSVSLLPHKATYTSQIAMT
jgi:hypothetical protein